METNLPKEAVFQVKTNFNLSFKNRLTSTAHTMPKKAKRKHIVTTCINLFTGYVFQFIFFKLQI